MENFSPKKYRDNLAENLKKVRSIGSSGKEAAKTLLSHEQGTDQYQESKQIHQEINQIDRHASETQKHLDEVQEKLRTEQVHKDRLVEKYEKSSFVLENGEKPFFEITLHLDKDKTPDQYIAEIQNRGYEILDNAEHTLKHMRPLKKSENIDLVEFSAEQLGFTDYVDYSEVIQRALDLGLKLCPQQVGPVLCTTRIDERENEDTNVTMLPSKDQSPTLWRVGRRYGDRAWIGEQSAYDVRCFGHKARFLFRI